MKIKITARRLVVRAPLREFVEQHLLAALHRVVHGIAWTHVELSDRNGRRGGGDKRCRVRITPVVGAAVLVEETEANLKRAFVRAVSKAQRLCWRQMRLVT